MEKVKTQEHPVSPDLAPQLALPSVVRKVDVLTWEKNLKVLLQNWLENPDSPYDRLIRELGNDFHNRKQEDVYQTQQKEVATSAFGYSHRDVAKSTLALLCRLQERDALPAILFNYDRSQCEEICRTVCNQLKTSEIAQKKSGTKWQKTLERWEEYKQQLEKTSKQMAQDEKRKSKKGRDKGGEDEKISSIDRQKENGNGLQDSVWASFDPDSPMDGYHFADYTKAQASELVGYTKELRFRGIQPWLIDALGRGIGVHHAGMNRKYRQIVEILFRKRFLRVVVATGTLALGINMPCKYIYSITRKMVC